MSCCEPEKNWRRLKSKTDRLVPQSLQRVDKQICPFKTNCCSVVAFSEACYRFSDVSSDSNDKNNSSLLLTPKNNALLIVTSLIYFWREPQKRSLGTRGTLGAATKLGFPSLGITQPLRPRRASSAASAQTPSPGRAHTVPQPNAQRRPYFVIAV